MAEAKSATPKKAAAKKPAAKKAAPTHPKYSEMINKAVVELKERKGASRAAIKKYIMANYKVDTLKVVIFNKALKKMTDDGTLTMSDNGARWKIKKAEKPAAAKKPAAKKASPKKPAAKKASPKKPAKKVVKKPAAKKPAAKKPAAKKAPAKKAGKVAKKPAAKKPAAKKAKK